MTGAMYSAIAGLRTHMQDLNVIGNNIANVNTKGYKPGRSVFRSSLYTQISGGREGTSVTGSKNPSQLGYGSSLATVDVDMSTGSYSPGLSSDMMIDGDGFFLLGNKELADVIDPKDPSTFKSFTLTRVGDISFKSDGYLSNGMGDLVYGFLCVGTVNGEPVFSDQLVPIRVPRMDGDGNIMWPHTETVAPEGQEATDENGKLTLVDTLYPEGEDGNDQTVQNPYVQAKLTNVKIGEDGVIEGTVRETGQKIIIGALAIGTVDNPYGVTQLTNTYYKCDAGAGELAINMAGGAGKDALVAYGNLPRAGAEDGDNETENFVSPEKYGQTATYGDVTIRRGMRYVNESQVNAGDDAGDDEELSLPYGSRLFDTGTATILRSGGLELSKTDLATEIANMITTQRGYQANTRIITVTDSMLEELVNMKR